MLRLYRIFAIIAHLLLGLLVLLTFRVKEPISPERWQRQAKITQWWHQRLCRMLGLQLHIQGVPEPGAALVVANHISWVDIAVIGAAHPVNFVSKREVAQWPVVGTLVARSGTAFIQRGGDANVVAEQMSARLSQGQRLVIFPEGTTGDGRSLRPFHPRLFQAAIRAECPVQAVALRYIEPLDRPPIFPFIGEDTFAGHLWRISAQPRTVVEVHWLPAQASAGVARRALADATRSQIHITLFGTPPPTRSTTQPELDAS